MIGANPFKRHSPFDFDLTKTSAIKIETSAANCTAAKSNILTVTTENKDFRISVSGFDDRRDIVVDARTV